MLSALCVPVPVAERLAYPRMRFSTSGCFGDETLHGLRREAAPFTPTRELLVGLAAVGLLVGVVQSRSVAGAQCGEPA